VVNDFGYGGITGTEFRFAKRFKVDVRYEYSTDLQDVSGQSFLLYSWLHRT
jgi:opacity protein-like surface antigen